MKRAAGIAGCVLALVAMVVRWHENPRLPSRLDRQAMLYELSLARPRSELIIDLGDLQSLDRQLAAMRQECPECTLLGSCPRGVRLRLGSALEARWKRADVDGITGGLTPLFTQYGDAPGAARALVRQYLSRLQRDGLVRKNPFGVLSPLPPPDPSRLSDDVKRGVVWGSLLAVSVLSFGLALIAPRRERSGGR